MILNFDSDSESDADNDNMSEKSDFQKNLLII